MYNFQALLQSLISSPPPSLSDASVSWSDVPPLILDVILSHELDVVKAGNLLHILPTQLAAHMLATMCSTTRCTPLIGDASPDAFGATMTLIKLLVGYKVAPKDLNRVVFPLPLAMSEHIKDYICPASWFSKQLVVIALVAFALGPAIFFITHTTIYKNAVMTCEYIAPGTTTPHNLLKTPYAMFTPRTDVSSY